jgi:hypothetical protein
MADAAEFAVAPIVDGCVPMDAGTNGGEAGQEPEGAAAGDEQQACSLCGALPSSGSTRCTHRGVWHGAFSDCSARCAWGLGAVGIGLAHWSCCYATDQDALCSKAQAHRFAPVLAPALEADDPPLFACDCPRYVVDLDAPPAERWQHIVTDFAEQLPSVLGLADDILGDMGSKVVEPLLAAATAVGFVQYGDELRGIAKATGLPVGRVVMLQIAYEAFAACTSVVVEGKDGHPLHIRTMDWEMPELQPLTVEVDFMQAGQVVFTATTWAGYLGVLTGVKPGVFSVSVNYRRTEAGSEEPVKAFAKNLQRGIARHWPISFLVRAALERCGTYQAACATLEQSELIAPTYLTICGVSPGEGCILSRDREGSADGSCVEARLSDGSPLVQANMDCWRAIRSEPQDDWQDICDSRRRRAFALRALGTGPASMEDLWLLMSLPPTLAHDTVYTVAMQPHTGELATRVEVTTAQKSAARRRYGMVRSTRYDSGGGGRATRQ